MEAMPVRPVEEPKDTAIMDSLPHAHPVMGEKNAGSMEEEGEYSSMETFLINKGHSLWAVP